MATNMVTARRILLWWMRQQRGRRQAAEYYARFCLLDVLAMHGCGPAPCSIWRGRRAARRAARSAAEQRRMRRIPFWSRLTPKKTMTVAAVSKNARPRAGPRAILASRADGRSLPLLIARFSQPCPRRALRLAPQSRSRGSARAAGRRGGGC